MIEEAHHHGIVVSDLKEATEFYGGALGLEKADELSLASEKFDRVIGVDGADVDIVLLEGNGILIELLEYSSPPGENVNEGTSPVDVGASHICFRVDDIGAIYDELSDSVEFINPPQELEIGVSVSYIKDPDGNMIELLEE